MQIKLQLGELVSLDIFKMIINNLEMETLGCICFDLCIDNFFWKFDLTYMCVWMDGCYLLNPCELCYCQSCPGRSCKRDFYSQCASFPGKINVILIIIIIITNVHLALALQCVSLCIA